MTGQSPPGGGQPGGTPAAVDEGHADLPFEGGDAAVFGHREVQGGGLAPSLDALLVLGSAVAQAAFFVLPFRFPLTVRRPYLLPHLQSALRSSVSPLFECSTFQPVEPAFIRVSSATQGLPSPCRPAAYRPSW
ncbi:hypothetical protein [Nonomuraea sp. NPDC049309]|uniref:hypothetical protein n=1 Tax=Nonomuraea sp. NPDC049309 TaxID=3364350 RepID=UPI0037207504